MTTYVTLTARSAYPGPVVGAHCVIIFVSVSIGVGKLEVVVPTELREVGTLSSVGTQLGMCVSTFALFDSDCQIQLQI